MLLLLLAVLASAPALTGCDGGPDLEFKDLRPRFQPRDFEPEGIRSWLRVHHALGDSDPSGLEAGAVLKAEGWTRESYANYRGKLVFGLLALTLHEERVHDLQEQIRTQRGLVARLRAELDTSSDSNPSVDDTLIWLRWWPLVENEAELQSCRDGTAYTEEGWRTLQQVIGFADELRAAGLGYRTPRARR